MERALLASFVGVCFSDSLLQVHLEMLPNIGDEHLYWVERWAKGVRNFWIIFGVGAGQNENQIDFFFFICHTDVLIVAIIYVFDKEAVTWRNFHPREEISNAGIFNVFIGFAIPYVC